MEYSRIQSDQIDSLWTLQRAYKAEIGEEEPSEADKARLKEALEKEKILFFGAWDGTQLIGCCSVTIGFSTFSYSASGVFEDFYIEPGYRHRGIARGLVRYAREQSDVSSLTVGCAPCDVAMYRSLGFTMELGTMLASGD